MTILSTFTFAEIIGYFAAALVFLTFYIRMMVPLRIVGICSNCAFIAYAYLDNLYPVLILHLFLLPLNILRLHQMLQLSRQVREAASGDLNMAWVRPYSIVRCAQEGEVLFKKGDAATAMFVVASGRYWLSETGIEIGPSQVVGELSLLAPKHTRTQTLECVEAGTIFELNRGQVERLFFQNQKFGFYFLNLVTARMSENNDRLEGAISAVKLENLELRTRIDRTEYFSWWQKEVTEYFSWVHKEVEAVRPAARRWTGYLPWKAVPAYLLRADPMRTVVADNIDVLQPAKMQKVPVNTSVRKRVQADAH